MLTTLEWIIGSIAFIVILLIIFIDLRLHLKDYFDENR